MTLYIYNNKHEVEVLKTHYLKDDSLCVILWEENKRFASLTINLSVRIMSNNVAFVNVKECPWAEKFIEENELGKKVGTALEDNDCKYPLYEFYIEKIKSAERKLWEDKYHAWL